jgi:putative oxidoreductase
LLIIIPKTRAIGALMILPVMAGIMLSHLLVFPAGLPVASVLLAILVWILYEKRANYLALLN